MLAIIGGTGLYNLDGIETLESREISTLWGNPSGPILKLCHDGIEFYFLPRHSQGHSITPTNINYRANIAALKSIGVNKIISFTAVGSLRDAIEPRHFVLPLQFIDRSKFRKDTFFDDIVGHVSMADPFHIKLQSDLHKVILSLNIPVHFGATVVTMEGPGFSTRAESEMYRSWNCDIINMTSATECKLANEAGIAYGCVAMSTDYDCWKTDEAPVTVEYVVQNLKYNATNAQKVLIEYLKSNAKTQYSVPIIKNAIMADEESINSSKILYLFPVWNQ
eukprot:NODE_212_length_12593_cov_0.662638.p8 type:complete len:278 gc:universal NODE_212_length_12593_cov_0.662638:12528-11695(-)